MKKQKLLTLLAALMAIAIIMSTPAYADLVTQEIPISDGNDDFEEEDDGQPVQLTSSDLDMSYDNSGGFAIITGLTFHNLQVEQGQGNTITDANIRFNRKYGNTLEMNLLIVGDADGYNPDPVNLIPSTRTKTTTKAAWLIADGEWASGTYYTSNISSVIAELVDDPNWVSGSSLTLYIYQDPNNASVGHRSAHDYNVLLPDEGPMLTVKATPNSATPVSATVTLTFAVNDGTNPALTDTMTIDMYEDACAAAIAAGPLPGDFNLDCEVDPDDLQWLAEGWLAGKDLADFADLAADWLIGNYELTVPVEKLE